MSRPNPVIFLPKLADQVALVRNLYPFGYRFLGRKTVDDSVAQWLGSCKGNGDLSMFPWMVAYSGQIYGYLVRGHCGSPSSFTLVNSPRHFVAYVSRKS